MKTKKSKTFPPLPSRKDRNLENRIVRDFGSFCNCFIRSNCSISIATLSIVYSGRTWRNHWHLICRIMEDLSNLRNGLPPNEFFLFQPQLGYLARDFLDRWKRHKRKQFIYHKARIQEAPMKITGSEEDWRALFSSASQPKKV